MLPAKTTGGEPGRLAAREDWPALTESFADQRRVLVPEILDSTFARRLHDRLKSWSQWALITRIQGQHREFDAQGMKSVTPDKRRVLDKLIHKEAGEGFQYLFERFPLYDTGRAGQLSDPVLAEAYALLRSRAFLDLGRHFTGEPSIQFADGQATRYRPGHFLTLHDDRADGMNRVAAYVINLTPEWGADFGGQLQFTDWQGRVEQVFTPGFNTLSLFSVPCPHFVSAVAPFAPGARYAITGWFRTGEEPKAP